MDQIDGDEKPRSEDRNIKIGAKNNVKMYLTKWFYQI